ncbi:unnamed protein product, partial [Brassica oleracea]
VLDFSWRERRRMREKKAFLSARKAIFRFLKFYSYLRRTLDGFCMNKNLTDHSKVEEAYVEGKKQLEVVERVVKVYLAYPPKTENIMELKLQ